MRLNKQTDYAFRVLIFLATRPGDQRSTIGQIAERFEMSHNHLMKIVHKLVQHQYIHSVRGAKGGLTLAKQADEIILADIVALMENQLEPFNCNEPMCVLARDCALRKVFEQARDAFMQVLVGYSLADVVNPKIQNILFPDLENLSSTNFQ